jgi:hypothetical protein
MLETCDHGGALLLHQVMVTSLPLQRQKVTLTSLSLQGRRGNILTDASLLPKL